VTPTTAPTGVPSAFVDLEAIADTYVEAGTEATWDHGGAPHMDVDTKPFGITYLKFDLTGVTTPVWRATLTLGCSNASPDGGTVYPVPDPSWIEGTGNGVDATSAGGLGLKWIDIDTNADGKVTADDASPYVPDLTRPLASFGVVASGQSYTVDVTAGITGPGLHSFAVRSGNSDGATYRSRQYGTVAVRPRLRLEF
jgi:hypothetical protein